MASTGRHRFRNAGNVANSANALKDEMHCVTSICLLNMGMPHMTMKVFRL